MATTNDRIAAPLREARRRHARKALLACGPVSSLLYLLAIDVVTPLAHPSYHAYGDQMVSELMAADAPSRELLLWLFVPYNVLVFGLACGVWMSSAAKRSGRVVATLLLAYGVMSIAGLLLFPMDLRGTVDSTRDPLHIAATGVMSLFIVAAMGAGAFMRRGAFRVYSIATVATVMVFGALAALLAGPMPGPTPWVGLAERVNIYASMVWFAALALVCWPDPHAASVQEGCDRAAAR